MNTVLDDNKMLCLSNGERIKLSAKMHMMFEVNDLAVASPRPSRAGGMVYMEAVYIGLAPYVSRGAQNALPKRLPQHGARSSSLLTKYATRRSSTSARGVPRGHVVAWTTQLMRLALQPARRDFLLEERRRQSAKGGLEG